MTVPPLPVRDTILRGHLLDHYGECKLGTRCICLKSWIGTDCMNWHSAGARTWAELLEWQKKRAAT